MGLAFSMIEPVLGDTDLDNIRRLFTEIDSWYLVLTLVISMLHTLFDVLAFKNDISFWKQRKSFVGLSTRSVLLSTASRVVILLYLVDHNTSGLVLFSTGLSTLISLWKTSKVLHVNVTWSGALPAFRRTTPTTRETRTDSHDAVAMQYLSYLAVPLVIGCFVYSWYTKPIISVYSWTLDTLAAAMYWFGFFMMMPQLYVNYKLKSVAHLPWRVLAYSALNTFIDDVFAFIIVMPDMHRLAVFRDDIVFILFMYQRCIYPTDRNRNRAVVHPDPAESADDSKSVSSVESDSEEVPTEEKKKNQ